MLNAQFQNFIHSEILKTSNFEYEARKAREEFKDYTHMEAQSFKDLINQKIKSIKEHMDERILHEQETLKMLNDKKLHIQEYKVQEVKPLDASAVFTKSSRINSGNKIESCKSGNGKNSSGNDYNNLGNERSIYGKESSSYGKVSNQSRNKTKNSKNDTEADTTDITPSYDTEPTAKG
nr:hypothetical protein [Tanacetum cinerariifolium]